MVEDNTVVHLGGRVEIGDHVIIDQNTVVHYTPDQQQLPYLGQYLASRCRCGGRPMHVVPA